MHIRTIKSSLSSRERVLSNKIITLEDKTINVF